MKVLVTDVDGTIMENGYINRNVRFSFDKLKEHGWIIILATARIFQTSLNVIKAIEPYKYCIFSDGAQIYNINTGQVIHELNMDVASAHSVISKVWDLPLEIQLFARDIVFVRVNDRRSRSFFNNFDMEVRTDLSIETVRAIQPVHIMLYGDTSVLRSARDIIQRDTSSIATEIKTIWAGENFLDILPSGTSKANAFLAMMEQMEMKPQVVVSVGDHLNDLEMMMISDLSACPSSAIADIKNIADMEFSDDPVTGIPGLVDILIERFA
jgi:Cof subfamily protein (haloacid dehalogenase superfamily)